MTPAIGVVFEQMYFVVLALIVQPYISHAKAGLYERVKRCAWSLIKGCVYCSPRTRILDTCGYGS